MGRLAELMKGYHGIDVKEDRERLLMDDLHAIMDVNKTMNLTRILSSRRQFNGASLHRRRTRGSLCRPGNGRRVSGHPPLHYDGPQDPSCRFGQEEGHCA